MIWAVALLLSNCSGIPAPPVRGESLSIIETVPHDRAAYTQGFAFHDGHLYESTGLYGESSIRKVAISSGEALERHDLSVRYFGEGLTVLGNRLYQITWREGTGFVYDISTLEQVDSFRYEGEGWGLTTDGSSLILSDGTYRLRFIDPETYQVTQFIEVTDGGRPVSAVNELEWVRGEIWANIWQEDNIARINPETGTVIGWLNVEGFVSRWDRWRGAEVANGIAYDSANDRLWVTGKQWPNVFRVHVPQ